MQTDQAATLRLLVDDERAESTSTLPRAARYVIVHGAKGGMGATTVAMNLAVALSTAAARVELTSAHGMLLPLAAGPGGILVRDVKHFRNALHGLQQHAYTEKEAESDLAEPDWCVIDAGVGVPGELPLPRESTCALLVTTTEPASILSAFDFLREAQEHDAWPEVLVNRVEDVPFAMAGATRLSNATKRMLARTLTMHPIAEDADVIAASRRGQPVALAHPHCPFSRSVAQLAARLSSKCAARAA
jgi:MinD-like ATPase involved in chromosome partitioning or flagellar assembly